MIFLTIRDDDYENISPASAFRIISDLFASGEEMYLDDLYIFHNIGLPNSMRLQAFRGEHGVLLIFKGGGSRVFSDRCR